MKKYVDFHLHSYFSRRNSDVINWYNAIDTLINLTKKGVKIFAITDHDIFCFRLYKELTQKINEMKLDITILPGVELTVKRKNGDKGHILFIFNHQTTHEKLLLLEKIINDLYGPDGTNLDNFIKCLNTNDFDYMLIPHVGKCHSIIFDDVKNHLDKISYIESPDNKRELINFNHQCPNIIKNIMFSDTHKWNEYSGSKVFLDYEDNDWDFNVLKSHLEMEK